MLVWHLSNTCTVPLHLHLHLNISQTWTLQTVNAPFKDIKKLKIECKCKQRQNIGLETKLIAARCLGPLQVALSFPFKNFVHLTHRCFLFFFCHTFTLPLNIANISSHHKRLLHLCFQLGFSVTRLSQSLDSNPHLRLFVTTPHQPTLTSPPPLIPPTLHDFLPLLTIILVFGSQTFVSAVVQDTNCFALQRKLCTNYSVYNHFHFPQTYPHALAAICLRFTTVCKVGYQAARRILFVKGSYITWAFGKGSPYFKKTNPYIIWLKPTYRYSF